MQALGKDLFGHNRMPTNILPLKAKSWKVELMSEILMETIRGSYWSSIEQQG